MDITELLSWLSGGPNFSPFVRLQGPVTAIVGLLLALIALAGLFFIMRGAFVWAFAGKNHQKRANGKEDVKQGAIQILIVFSLAVVLGIVGSILNTVFSTV